MRSSGGSDAAQDLTSWRQTGVLYLWCHSENAKNYPGWHLATDRPGHASFLDLLRRLRTATEFGGVRGLRTTVPTAEVLAIANNRRDAAISPKRILVTAAVSADKWAIVEVTGDVRIELGADHLDGLVRWLSDPTAAFDTTYGSAPPLWSWGLVDGVGHLPAP
jgi:hypothetical protein